MIPASPVLPGLTRFESVYGQNQPEYLPLPALRNPQGTGIATRWRLSWGERLRLLWTGDLFIEVLTFGKPLQPIKPSAEEPDWASFARKAS